MIKAIKNISGESLDWGNGFILPIGGVTESLEVWRDPEYSKLCEYTTLGKVEVYNYDGSIMPNESARIWAGEKLELINNRGHYPFIYDLVHPYFKGMPFHDIDYKRNLLTGVSLHQEFEFTKEGFLKTTQYWHNYKSPSEKGVKVLEVDSVYNLDQQFTIPSSNPVLDRATTRKWFKTDNSEESNTKLSLKVYDTQNKQNIEGKKRRENKLRLTSKDAATAIILTGAAQTPEEAQDEIIKLSNDYSGSLYSFELSGRGDVYQDIIDNQTFSWMDNLIPDNSSTQALISDGIGSDIRTYIIDKLKGFK